MIVKSPLSATTTVVPAGKPGLAFPTSSFTLSFSSSVSCSGFSTIVNSGPFGTISSAIVATTLVCISELNFLSGSPCDTFINSPIAREPKGISISHFPSGFTNVLTTTLSDAPSTMLCGKVTIISDPGTPVPVIFLSSESTLSTVGSADISFSTIVSSA